MFNLFFYDSFSGLPDDVTHKPGNVDWIDGSTLAKVLEQPFFRLVVDEFVVGADAGFA